MTQRRGSASTLLCGDTGTGKTNLLATLAEWEFNRIGAIMDYIVTDLGGWGDYMQALIDEMIVRPVRLFSRDPGDAQGLGFETLAQSTMGWMPAAWDLKTGDMAAGTPLIPPVSTVFRFSCPSGHTLQEGPDRPGAMAIKCGTCGVVTNLGNGMVTSMVTPTPGFPLHRLWACDGLTSACNWVMRDLAGRVGRNQLGGEESAIGGKIQSGSISLGGSNRSHYNFGQLRAEEYLLNSLAIPGLARPPIWTALEQRAVDADTKLPIYGPQITGKAKAAEVPAWVGNCLGTAVVKNAQGKDEWRLYLREYILGDGIPHLCKTRATPGVLPEFLTDGPPLYSEGGKVEFKFVNFNLGHFFELLDSALEKTKKEIAARYEGRPRALVEGTKMEIGASVAGTAPASVVVPGYPTVPGMPPPPAGTPSAPAASGGPLAPSEAPAVPSFPVATKRSRNK